MGKQNTFLFSIFFKNLKIEIYKTKIWPVVLYGCETWSLTLSEEWRLRAFANGILKRIFGAKRDANGERWRLYNEELHSLYHSPNIIRVNKPRTLRWAGHVARMEESRSAFKILTGKPTGNRLSRNNLREKFSPEPGFKPESPALCAGAITTKSPRWSSGPN